MFKYGIRRNFKTKYANNIDKYDKKESNYTKMYNLELETINSNTILKLQNRIGNMATKELLEELSMTEIVNKNSNEIKLSAVKQKPYDKNNMANNEIRYDLRKLSKSYSNKTDDVLKRNMLYKENRENGRISLNSENIFLIIHKLDELSTMLKLNNYDLENKNLEIKNSDKMLDNIEKVAVSDVDLIFSMISNLPKYNEDQKTIKVYMKVINLLSNTGIGIIEFLNLNNNINEQKKLLYNAMGANRVAE